MGRRVILIVLDSMGVGELPDAREFGDEGAFTLKSASTSKYFYMPNMEKLGLFEIDGVKGQVSSGVYSECLEELSDFGQVSFGDGGACAKALEEKGYKCSYGRFSEKSKGKDTTIGHWEIAGVVSESPLPTFPDGFGREFIERLEKLFMRPVLCDKPYSGTEVIKDYGREAVDKGAVIVYTSADSVLQIAAHTDVVPLEELYKLCEIAREECVGEFGVGRVIARPFNGEWPYTRTKDRHDYSIKPPKATVMDTLMAAGKETVAIGKIVDIFAGSGITSFTRTSGNPDGIEKTIEEAGKRYEGLCFVNLVDTDMLYGHRRDIDGYAKALSYFDAKLPEILGSMGEEDMLIVTADHGCDPGFKGTDHTREYIPCVCVGRDVEEGNFGTKEGFDCISRIVKDFLSVK